jgi:hypothetical protein
MPWFRTHDGRAGLKEVYGLIDTVSDAAGSPAWPNSFVPVAAPPPRVGDADIDGLAKRQLSAANLNDPLGTGALATALGE